MARPTEIDLAHARAGGDFLGRTLQQNPSSDHHDDAMCKTEHDVHVVLDEQHRDLLREAGDDREYLGALLLRHTGRRLVEQQHLRLGGERDRLERAEVGKQCVDLKGAHEAAFDALLGPERRDLVCSEKDLSFVGLDHAGDQIDQRGLAGAVRPDQRVALARWEIELDVARDDERAEALVQAARRQRRGAHARLRPERTSRAAPPRMPFGRKITTATNSVPIQKYQYCGLMPENWSRATM